MAGRSRTYPSWPLLLLLLVLGGIIGAWIGDVVVKIWPGLSLLRHVYNIGLPTFSMDLHVFSLSFGFMFKVNFFSIIGFILAWVLYRLL